MQRITARQTAFLGLLTAAAVLFGYVELLIPLDFIAPGIKLGVANAAALYLICLGRPKWAFAVNLARILLSVLLFSNAFSLIYSLTAGLSSTLSMCLAARWKRAGILGISWCGAFTHNTVQWIVARMILGGGVLFYLPFLWLAAVVTGSLLGLLVYFMLQKIKVIF